MMTTTTSRNKNIGFAVIAVFLIGGIFATSSLSNNRAWAVEDDNGIILKSAIGTYNLTYTTQYYDTSGAYDEEFGIASDPSSMRMYFHGINTASVMLAGYFKLSSGSCTNHPDEELAAELNGGYHTGTTPDPNTPTSTTPEPNSNYADTMHLGFDFEAQDSRVRWEITHPNYSTAIFPNSDNRYSGVDLCSSPDGWVGGMWFKLNVDSNCDGVKDKVLLVMYVDTTGLNTDGTPKNNWIQVYRHDFNLSDIPTKGKLSQWVTTVGETAYAYETIRIDNQDNTDWNDGSPNDQFVTLKRVTGLHNSC